VEFSSSAGNASDAIVARPTRLILNHTLACNMCNAVRQRQDGWVPCWIDENVLSAPFSSDSPGHCKMSRNSSAQASGDS
jgi:hypothetical protein